jgi:hypothetical protein
MRSPRVLSAINAGESVTSAAKAKMIVAPVIGRPKRAAPHALS